MEISLQNLTEIKDGVSKKKVYRKSDQRLSKIIIDFSNDHKEFYNFIDVYDILKLIDITIPRLYEVHFNKKIIIMEDLGDKIFHNILKDEQLYNLLKIAIDNLIIIQNSLINKNILKLSKYSINDLRKEISEFVEYYIPYKKISNFNVNFFYNTWEKIFYNENFSLDSFNHKDFEFINLIFLKDKNSHFKCGIIDFQSAFSGFKGWDLFSILENPRINFTRKYNEDLMKYFYNNVYITSDYHTFRNQYYLLNLVRQTRLLGRWVKLSKEGYIKYLDFIKPTEERAISALSILNDKDLKYIYKSILAN